MKKVVYITAPIYVVLHTVLFTYYPATPKLSETQMLLGATQWLLPIACFVFLIPGLERLPLKLVNWVGLVLILVCATFATTHLPGLWWSWSTLGFIIVVALLVINDTNLLALAAAVVFLGFGSWEIIYQVGLWHYHEFFGSELSNLMVVIAENLMWVISSLIILLVLQRRYKIFRPNNFAAIFFSLAVASTVIWFANGMDVPLLWWRGNGPWVNESARQSYIILSRCSQACWLLGTATLFTGGLKSKCSRSSTKTLPQESSSNTV